MKKRTDAEVENLWRMVLAVVCARSGMKLSYVLDLVPYVGRVERNLLVQQANGCRHLAIYLLRTHYQVTLPQLARVAELSHQHIHRIVAHVAKSRDENIKHYDEWLKSYEDTLDSIDTGETVDA